VAARAERDERNLDREIRSEQEVAFQETLKRDQEREQRRAEEDARRQEVAEAEARVQEEEERLRRAEQDKKMEIQRQKIELASKIPEEPEVAEEEAVRVLIKLPGGQVRPAVGLPPQQPN
jgi:FAS-associated factor 2